MLYRIVLWIQTIYYLSTALWALVDIKSFMTVTGPKTDIWLVKTVAVLLLAIAVTFITSLVTNDQGKPVPVLAATCCIVLIVIDCQYVFKETISKIYLADAVVETILLILWLIAIGQRKKQKNSY